jgi:hypothetical protein
MATILTKKKDTTGAPSSGDLTNSTGGAELAVNTADKRLYTKDSGGNVVEVGINPTSITTGTLNTSGAVVFNDAGADVDFRVEGDTNANLLFVDAGNDRVGIGTAAPGAPLEILTTGGTNLWLNSSATTDQTNRIASLRSSGGSYSTLTIDAQTHLFRTGTTERMRIDSSGNLLVGTTSTGLTNTNSFIFNVTSGESAFQHNNSAVGGTVYCYFTYNGGTIGTITQNGTTAVAYNTTSDYRLKHDIQPMTGALAKVAQLKPVTYKWNADDSDGEGFIAHELQEVAPYAVSGEKDGEQMQGVDYGKITPLLTAALQEAIAEIQSLKARVAELESK